MFDVLNRQQNRFLNADTPFLVSDPPYRTDPHSSLYRRLYPAPDSLILLRRSIHPIDHVHSQPGLLSVRLINLDHIFKSQDPNKARLIW